MEVKMKGRLGYSIAKDAQAEIRPWEP